MSAMTMAASSVARTPLDAARTTMRPTTSTPSRSIATMRSGSVGPRTMRTNAISTASARITMVACVISSSTSGSLSVCRAEQHPYALLESGLDVASRFFDVLDVHDVHIERLPIVGQVDGHAAGRDVDQHREQQDLLVRLHVERHGHDGRRDVVAAEHVGGDFEIGVHQLAHEVRDEAQGVERAASDARGHDAAAIEHREDGEAHGVSGQEVAERDLALERCPRERQEDASERHQGAPPRTAWTYGSRASNCSAPRSATSKIGSAPMVMPIIRTLSAPMVHRNAVPGCIMS